MLHAALTTNKHIELVRMCLENQTQFVSGAKHNDDNKLKGHSHEKIHMFFFIRFSTEY